MQAATAACTLLPGLEISCFHQNKQHAQHEKNQKRQGKLVLTSCFVILYPVNVVSKDLSTCMYFQSTKFINSIATLEVIVNIFIKIPVENLML